MWKIDRTGQFKWDHKRKATLNGGLMPVVKALATDQPLATTLHSPRFLCRSISVLMLSMATSAHAGLEEGIAAFNHIDYPKAIVELTPLAESGNKMATAYLKKIDSYIYCCRSNELISEEFRKEIILRKAAESGDVDASFHVGGHYQEGMIIPWVKEIKMTSWNGVFVKPNKKLAEFWYRKSAEQGYAKAQCKLADVLFYSDPAQREEAISWYQKSAAQHDSNAIKTLRAIHWVIAQEKKAETGDMDAMMALAEAHRTGGINENYNYLVSGGAVEELKWTVRAAENGNVRAQFNAGDRYRWIRSRDTQVTRYRLADFEKNGNEAMRFYRMAAIENPEGAMHHIAEMYEQGDGVPVNRVIAYAAFRAAFADDRAEEALEKKQQASRRNSLEDASFGERIYAATLFLSTTDRKQDIANRDAERVAKNMSRKEIEDAEKMSLEMQKTGQFLTVLDRLLEDSKRSRSE